MNQIFSSMFLSRETKRKLYISYLYGYANVFFSETWWKTKVHEIKLITLERKILRRIYNTETNADIERLFNGPNV